jgi:glycerol kinase
MIFDEHANVISQYQLEFPQYYPHPGSVLSQVLPLLYLLPSPTRWHEHDALEIVDHAERCIDAAIKELEGAGWAKESVKVIGTFLAPFRSLGFTPLRHHQPKGDHRRVES